ncbi:MAG TPA: hypothetical protein VGH89_37215, partial [Pseudonocardia sp.]
MPLSLRLDTSPGKSPMGASRFSVVGFTELFCFAVLLVPDASPPAGERGVRLPAFSGPLLRFRPRFFAWNFGRKFGRCVITWW